MRLFRLPVSSRRENDEDGERKRTLEKSLLKVKMKEKWEMRILLKKKGNYTLQAKLKFSTENRYELHHALNVKWFKMVNLNSSVLPEVFSRYPACTGMR